MKTPFFVTGMPRSRTAWLAAFLTTDSTICYHDVLLKSAVPAMISQNPCKRVGLSGSEVCTEFDNYSKLYPDAPWLVVLRDDAEALASFKVIAKRKSDLTDGTIENWWKPRRNLLQTMLSQPKVLGVGFDSLNIESVIRGIWAHLLPGIEFDFVRWDMLKKLNIQAL